MTRDETRMLLRHRSALTSQPYGDDAIIAWHDALNEWTLDECRLALTRASREHKTITVAHLVERLPYHPKPGTSTQVHHRWDGPTDRGRAMAAEIREHINHRNEPDHPALCTICRHDRYPSVTDDIERDR